MENNTVKIIDRLLNSTVVTAVVCVGIATTLASYGEAYNADRAVRENRNVYYVVSIHETEPSCAWWDHRFLDFKKAQKFARAMSQSPTVSHVRLYNKTWRFEPTYFKGEIHCPTNGEHPDVWDRMN
jgi:hypothetical protein